MLCVSHNPSTHGVKNLPILILKLLCSVISDAFYRYDLKAFKGISGTVFISKCCLLFRCVLSNARKGSWHYLKPTATKKTLSTIRNSARKMFPIQWWVKTSLDFLSFYIASLFGLSKSFHTYGVSGYTRNSQVRSLPSHADPQQALWVGSLACLSIDLESSGISRILSDQSPFNCPHLIFFFPIQLPADVFQLWVRKEVW